MSETASSARSLTSIQILAEPDGFVEDDELVVYRNEAIKPAYLVIYEPFT